MIYLHYLLYKYRIIYTSGYYLYSIWTLYNIQDLQKNVKKMDFSIFGYPTLQSQNKPREGEDYYCSIEK